MAARWCWRHKATVPGESVCQLCAAHGVLTHLSDGPDVPPANVVTEQPVLDTFTRAYLTAALWVAEHDDLTFADIDPAAIKEAIDDCKDFQDANREDLDEVSDTYHVDDSQHGHDFFLSRNGHGAGFFDRGYDLNGLGDKLQRAARVYGTHEAHEDLSENGIVYFHN